MAIEKVVNIVVNQKGTEKAQAQIEKLNTSLKKVKANTGEVAKGMKDSGNAILENGGAMGLLNDLTGGYAMTVKDAVEATGLFTKGTTLATAGQKIYTLVVGSTTGALKALRIALVSTGLGAIVVLLGIFISKMMESAEATEEQKRQQELLNESLKKSSELYKQNIKDLEDVTKERILRAKIAGKSEADLRKIEKEGADQRYKEYKSEQDRLYGLLGDKKLTAEQTKTINDELTANQKEYFDGLNEEKLKDLESELSVVEAKRQANKDAIEKRKEDEKKAEEERQENLKKQREKELQDNEDFWNKYLEIAGNARTREQSQIDAQKEFERLDLENTTFIADSKLAKLKENSQKELEISKAEAEQKRAIQDGILNVASATANLLGAIAGKNKAVQKASIITENAVGIAKMIIANNQANIGALATPQAIASSGVSAAPVIAFNNITTGLAVASTLVATAKALKAVGGGDAGGGAGATGGGASAPTPPSFNLVQGTGSNQIAQGLANERRPLQAYVVSGAVSTSQALERNIINDAKL
jgi:hypothetical protein